MLNARDFQEGETPRDYVNRRYHEIEGLISAQHHLLHGDEKEEAIADTLAIFWSEFSKLAAAGRDAIRLLPRIVQFAAMRVRCGRTLTNGNPARDVLSSRCRFRNGYKTSALPLSDRDPVAGEILDAMRDDRSPADQAVLNVDFETWMATLNFQQHTVAGELAAGLNQKDVADRMGVTRTRVWQVREDLRASWEAMFGD